MRESSLFSPRMAEPLELINPYLCPFIVQRPREGQRPAPSSHSKEVENRVKPIFHLLAWDLFQEEILEDEPHQVDVTCIVTCQGTPSP